MMQSAGREGITDWKMAVTLAVVARLSGDPEKPLGASFEILNNHLFTVRSV